MDASLLNPSRFLKSQSFAGREPTFTIKAVRIEELESNDGQKKVKGIVSFQEIAKEWVLNRTVVECLKAMWGRETNDWHGHKVTLWAAPFHDNTTGEDTTCIRVKGSPDLPTDMSVTITLPRKKPFTVPLTKTATGKPAAKANGNGKPKGTAQTPPPPPPEMSDEDKAAALAAEQATGSEPF
jgi:hypothetical protein